MPELPDVEVFKRHLDETSLRRTIKAVSVNDARILHGLPAEDLAARLEGNRFERTRRHGKHLLVELGKQGWLTLHFGMTGNLTYFEDDGDDPPYDRVRLDFQDGHLAYVNRRMLGRVGLADDANAFIENEGLGPRCPRSKPRSRGVRADARGPTPRRQVRPHGSGHDRRDRQHLRR